EHDARPAAGTPWKEAVIDACPGKGLGGCPNDDAVLGSLGGAVAPGNDDLDVGKTAPREMCLELRLGLFPRHVWHQPEIELGLRPSWKHGLAPWPGVAADEPLDVDRGLRGKPIGAGQEILVPDPLLYAELLLDHRLVAQIFRDQLLLAIGERFHILEPAIDRRREAVVRDQRVERLDEAPRRAVDPRHQARMNILFR